MQYGIVTGLTIDFSGTGVGGLRKEMNRRQRCYVGLPFRVVCVEKKNFGRVGTAILIPSEAVPEGIFTGCIVWSRCGDCYTKD
jgi:hypothetical protein